MCAFVSRNIKFYLLTYLLKQLLGLYKNTILEIGISRYSLGLKTNRRNFVTRLLHKDASFYSKFILSTNHPCDP